MLHPAYPIHTSRLTLRPFSPAVVDDVLAYQSREDVCRYIPYPPRTRERVAERTAPPYMARTDARNTGSIGVLRRLGMRQEAYLEENEWFKGEWSDEIDFAILDSEWEGWGGGAEA